VDDPQARLPAFQQYLASFVARAINAYHGRVETFRAPNSYSAVVLGSPEDVVAKTDYTLANPVAASMLTAAFHIHRDGVEFRDLGPAHLDRHDKTKTINRLVKRLRDLGCSVEIPQAA